VRTVQCHGCFDLLHIGHLRHFAAAKQAGDRLVVSVTSDAYVQKGPGRPAFPAHVRAEAVRAVRCVDDVVISDAPTAANAIRTIRPQVFAKGIDYAGGIHPEEQAAIADVGAELLITTTEKWSSTALLREPNDYLDGIRAKHGAREVHGWLEQARSLNVLVVGDAIRDEYHFVDTLGKSGKDPMLAAKFVRAESFEGGAVAVANHAEACADVVNILAGPLTVKRRFVEQYPLQKLFEVYELDEHAANDETPYLLETLPDMLAQADLVIVADYGHGLLTPPVVELLTDQAKCLAVNTQANAGNHGFNTISKYRRANFISLSERELRLDARDQQSDIRHLMNKRGDAMIVTRGEKGCIAYRPDQGFTEAPALTTHAVDRTGAGDAVFAVTACCAAVGMPLDLMAFMASVVGTQAVGIVGNAKYIERDALTAAIDAVLA
jgi:cytidyltransferase-like protein